MRLIAWRHVAVSEPDGGFTGILCSGDDVTDARRAEAEAKEARERMMHVSRLATMGEMAAGISHELNQPLAAITTYAQAASRLLADATQDEDVADALEQIAAQALRAGEIIRRLRNLVRNRETQREPTQINSLIEELGTLTRADARMYDVRVMLELAPHLPVLNLDPIQIQQVLLNLVRNAVQAVQYSESNEREIVISTALKPTGMSRSGSAIPAWASRPTCSTGCSCRSRPPRVTAPDWGSRSAAVSLRRTREQLYKCPMFRVAPAS